MCFSRIPFISLTAPVCILWPFCDVSSSVRIAATRRFTAAADCRAATPWTNAIIRVPTSAAAVRMRTALPPPRDVPAPRRRSANRASNRPPRTPCHRYTRRTAARIIRSSRAAACTAAARVYRALPPPPPTACCRRVATTAVVALAVLRRRRRPPRRQRVC